MSNEIKYVNKAGVRRIITDTRARLTDLTTDMDSAFGFSLDLSNIDTDLDGGKVISFSLPKEFSTNEYDIFVRLHTKLTRTATQITINDTVSHAEALIPLSSATTRDTMSEHHFTPIIVHEASTETVPGQTINYIRHSIFGIYTEVLRINAKLTSSVEGVYSLDVSPSMITDGYSEHIYGSVSSEHSINMDSISVDFATISESSLGISYNAEIEAIEILVRKKLEATAE